MISENSEKLTKLLESRREIRKLAHDRRFWSDKIARAAENIMGQCDVYVFGSIVKGKDVGASDVELLVVCDKKAER